MSKREDKKPKREFTYFEVAQRRSFTFSEGLYLLYGKENLLKSEILNKIIEQVSPPEARDFNLEFLDGETSTADHILNLASTLPFMAERRLVVVKNADKLKAEEQIKLAQGLHKISTRSCVVLVAGDNSRKERAGQEEEEAEETEKEVEESREEAEESQEKFTAKTSLNRSLEKTIRKKGVIIGFPSLTGWAVKNWVRERLKRWGKKVDAVTLEYLVKVVGNDLTKLNNEIEKLVNWLGEGEMVSREDIDNVVCKSPEANIFRLVDAIGEKEASQALQVLDVLWRESLDLPKEPHKRFTSILRLISRQFRLIWQAKFLQEVKYLPAGIRNKEVPMEFQDLMTSEANIISFLQAHPYWTEKFVHQAYNFSYRQLEHAFEKLLETDLATKGILGDLQSPRANLELLITNLCGL